MLKWVVAALVLIWAAPAAANDAPVYGKPAAWVKAQPFVATPPDDSADAARVALQDLQIRYSAQGSETFTHLALELRSPQALVLGNLALNWDPSTDELVIHQVLVRRGETVIDVLGRGETFTILRREQRLESAFLDGRLTATLQVQGIQVGDVLDVAYTLRHKDPVMQGRGEMLISLNRGKVGRLYLREVWANDRPVRWRARGLMESPKVTRTSEGTELVLDLRQVDTPTQGPAGAPARYASPGRLAATEFADWADIAGIMAPMYQQAATLAADSPLKAEVAKIAAASADPKVRAAAALRLVQDQVRYLFLGMNLGGYTPASAETTWTRRFGDCKGKSVLLVALLRELGIEADVAFVSTVVGDGLDEQLPLVEVFDHAIVRARIDGKTYWLDGTRQGDRNIDRIVPPAFRWALALRPAATLEPILVPPPELPLHEMTVRMDATAGLDAPVLVQAEAIIRGGDALTSAFVLKSLSGDKLDEMLKAFWAEFPWNVEPLHLAWSVDESTGDVHFTMDGAGGLTWTDALGARPRRWQATDMTIGWRPDLKREPGPDDDAPYAIQSPLYSFTRVIVKLPLGGVGFKFTGGDVDQTVAGYQLTRRMRLEGGVFTGEAGQRALVTEIAFADKQAAESGLLALNGNIYLEAPRGYERSKAEMEIEAARSGKTFFEYASRAEALFQLGQTDRAIATLDAGVDRDPELASAYNMRCWTLGRANRDLKKALADCEKALSLRPNTASYLDSRALVYFRMGQFDNAVADYDAALERSPELSPSLYMRGVTKHRLGQTDDGDDDIDTALALDAKAADQFSKIGIAP